MLPENAPLNSYRIPDGTGLVLEPLSLTWLTSWRLEKVKRDLHSKSLDVTRDVSRVTRFFGRPPVTYPEM